MSLAHADTVYSPTDGVGNGNITLSINNAASYTHFGADFIVSSSSGRYSHVLACGGSVGTTTAFYDTDYIVGENPLTHELTYSPAYSGFTPLYSLQIFGHPRLAPGAAVSIPSSLPPGIMGDFANVPAGKYTVEYRVKDDSVVNSGGGSVSDEDYVHEFDIYLMDLAERERTLYMRQNDIYRIDLSTIPAEFPHENCCFLTVSWATVPMPGMNFPSDLYTDAACNNLISPDTPGGVSKTWQAGSVPQYIYFRMPAFGKTINLCLTATNSIQIRTLAQKNLTFTSTGLYCHLAANSSLSFYDYCNRLIYPYSQGLWKDNETISGSGLDGFAFEAYNYRNDDATEDKNTPFVVKKGDKLKLTELELADTGTNAYDGTTDYITGANTSFPFGSSHFTVTQETGYKRLTATDVVESVNAVSNTVGIKYLSLPWKVQTSGGSNIASGSCDIKVYVPNDTPLTALCSNKLYESLLSLSCSAASGASTQADVFDLIWKKFQTCNIRSLDGRVLTYYGHGNSTPNLAYDTDELLKYADGRCDHWSKLFIDTLRSQGMGISYSNRLAFNVGAIPSALIGFDEIHGEAYYYGNMIADYDAVGLKQIALRFQGGGDPNAAHFQNHVINIYNNKLYDVTDGRGGYDHDDSGFLQYLRENCFVTVYDVPVCSGNQLQLSNIEIIQLNQ
ncbi:MAG: hypothetical protein ILO36_04140 [Abditibacteriota bacterium]|nr:hypothetical protein [Abditibacteriota bacterium]